MISLCLLQLRDYLDKIYLRKFILLINYIVLLWVVSFCQELQAKDFGIEGHTYQIVEEDILELIKKRLAQIDLKSLNKKIQTKTREYIEKPTPVANITKAKEAQEYTYDPTYILNEDISDSKGKIIHHAGTKINPLEFTNLNERLLFIDGDDKAQVKLALNLTQKYENRLKIILIKGSPLLLQREYKHKQIWFYFDQGGFITQKLSIKEVPALVEQEGMQLKIKIIALEEKQINKLKNEQSRELYE